MRAAPNVLVVMALASLPSPSSAVSGSVSREKTVSLAKLELWTSPRYDWNQGAGNNPGPNADLFMILEKVEIGFGAALDFDINHYINSGNGVCPSVDKDGVKYDEEVKVAICNASCTNELRYCEAPPTDRKHMGVGGATIVTESLRRQCIWQTYHNNDKWSSEKKWFRYVGSFQGYRCDLKGFPQDCINKAYDDAKIDGALIDTCMEVNGGITKDAKNLIFEGLLTKQHKERIDSFESLPAVLINDKKLDELTESKIFAAVCRVLPEDARIDSCKDLLLDEDLGEDEDPKTVQKETLEVDKEILQIAKENGASAEAMVEISEGEAKSVEEEEEDAEEKDEEKEDGHEANETLKEGVDLLPTSPPSTKASEPITKTLKEGEEMNEAVTPKDANTTKAEETPSPKDANTTKTKATASPNDDNPTKAVGTLSPSEAPVEKEMVTKTPKEAETPEADDTTETEAPSAAATEKLAATKKPNTENLAATKTPKEGETPEVDKGKDAKSSDEGKTPQDEQSTKPVEVSPKTSAPKEEELSAVTESKTASKVVKTEAPKEENLDPLDLALVDTAVNHLEALQNCEVDTDLLMKKLKALGSGGQLKKETENIESDLPLLMTQTCPHEQGVEILHRLRNFQGCAMFDLQALIETFPSTAVGVAIRCANAYSNMTKEEEESGFIPEACIRTVEASSVLGRGIFGLYLYPDVACPCFEKLADGIPECTADVWPIPINGALLKTQSCLVGQYCQTIDHLCENNMDILNDCLPARGTIPKGMDCGKIFEKCSAVYEKVHPLFNSAPLPDACVRIAQGSKFFGTHMVERYDSFRHQCGQNIELWEGHSKVAEFKSFVQEGVFGIDYQSVPFVSGAAGGFLAGVIFTIVIIVVRMFCICVHNCVRSCCDWCLCRKKKKDKRPPVKDYVTVETTEGNEMGEYRD